MNCYKITTGLNEYYVTSWTMAGAIIKFSQNDDYFTEVCEGEQECFKIEAIEAPEIMMQAIEFEFELILNVNTPGMFIVTGSEEYHKEMSEIEA